MEIKKLVLGEIEVNCYLISTENAAVVIDCGYYTKEAEDFLNNNSSKERLIILTHGHFDHIGAAPLLRDKTNVKIAVGEHDAEALKDPYLSYAAQFRQEIIPFTADILLKDGESLKVGDLEFKVLNTPGHTHGSICLLCGKTLFSGDTLFCESVGRTDIGGSFTVLKKSLAMLMKLGDDVTVYSGHGPTTTIKHEKKFNPYIQYI